MGGSPPTKVGMVLANEVELEGGPGARNNFGPNCTLFHMPVRMDMGCPPPALFLVCLVQWGMV